MSKTMTEPEAALLRFVDNEAGGIVQALRSMAERNRADAKALEADPGVNAPGVRQVMRVLEESAESWEAKARRFDDLFDALPAQDDDAPYVGI
jgi:hypothetical protein